MRVNRTAPAAAPGDVQQAPADTGTMASPRARKCAFCPQPGKYEGKQSGLLYCPGCLTAYYMGLHLQTEDVVQ